MDPTRCHQHPPDGVAFHDVEASTDEDDGGSELGGCREDERVENGEKFVVSTVWTRERDVYVTTSGFTRTDAERDRDGGIDGIGRDTSG